MILASLGSFLIDLIIFFAALSLLILVHELGHFFFAKLFKVYCYEFSLGMGPLLFQKSRKNDETKYSIRALPIGGYVAMAGENVDEDSSIPYERTINGVASWKKMIIVIAGVTMNFLLALVIFIGIFQINGLPSNKNYVDVSDTSSIAYQAGLRSNDKITQIDSYIFINGTREDIKSIEVKKITNLTDFLNENYPDKEAETQVLTFTVVRKDQTLKIEMNRGYTDGKVQLLGISQQVKRMNFFKTIAYSIDYEFEVMGLIFKGVGSLFTKKGFNDVGGPIKIFQVTSEAASNGALNFFMLLAVLSANLGVVNLLPIPALDGARFFTSLFEVVTRKKVNPKVEAKINAVGMMFLLAFMAVIIVKDIISLF